MSEVSTDLEHGVMLDMLDLIFVVVTIAFFAVSIGYVAACDRLK